MTLSRSGIRAALYVVQSVSDRFSCPLGICIIYITPFFQERLTNPMPIVHFCCLLPVSVDFGEIYAKILTY